MKFQLILAAVGLIATAAFAQSGDGSGPLSPVLVASGFGGGAQLTYCNALNQVTVLAPSGAAEVLTRYQYQSGAWTQVGSATLQFNGPMGPEHFTSKLYVSFDTSGNAWILGQIGQVQPWGATYPTNFLAKASPGMGQTFTAYTLGSANNGSTSNPYTPFGLAVGQDGFLYPAFNYSYSSGGTTSYSVNWQKYSNTMASGAADLASGSMGGGPTDSGIAIYGGVNGIFVTGSVTTGGYLSMAVAEYASYGHSGTISAVAGTPYSPPSYAPAIAAGYQGTAGVQSGLYTVWNSSGVPIGNIVGVTGWGWATTGEQPAPPSTMTYSTVAWTLAYSDVTGGQKWASWTPNLSHPASYGGCTALGFNVNPVGDTHSASTPVIAAGIAPSDPGLSAKMDFLQYSSTGAASYLDESLIATTRVKSVFHSGQTLYVVSDYAGAFTYPGYAYAPGAVIAYQFSSGTWQYFGNWLYAPNQAFQGACQGTDGTVYLLVNNTVSGVASVRLYHFSG